MAKVYRIGSPYGTEYTNTAREADRVRPGGEEPESITRVDAAGECNRLDRMIDEAERTIRCLRMLLEDLRNVCPVEVTHKTDAGRRANKFISENPLPPADAADREGQRSYGV
jgi:hypothetical protein